MRCEHITSPSTGERFLAAVENVVLIPTLRVVPRRGKSHSGIEVRSIEQPKGSGRPDLNEPFVAWITKLARTLFPVRPNDDTVITGFVDLSNSKRYRVAFDVAPGVTSQQAAAFLIASSEEYGFTWHVELPGEEQT